MILQNLECGCLIWHSNGIKHVHQCEHHYQITGAPGTKVVIVNTIVNKPVNNIPVKARSE